MGVEGRLAHATPTLTLPLSTRGGEKSGMKIHWTILLLLPLIGGCAGEPFVREPLPVLHHPDPKALRNAFARTVTDRFISDDTVIIQAPFRNDLAVLGVLRVDRVAGTFELVGLNHLGVKLFDLNGDRQGTTVRFAIPPLMNLHQVLVAIGDDIRRMYFDLVPGGRAEVQIERRDVKFTQKENGGRLVYVFGGQPGVLLEKRSIGFFGAVWRVRYYRYESQEASLYPAGIVMDNNQFHYRIIVKNRDREIQ